MENKNNKSSATSAYRKTEVMTANKETILLMMYAGAIRFLKQAKEKKEEKSERTRLVGRAQEIVNELRSTLNFDIGKEIAEHLDALYAYISNRLMEAVLKHDDAPIDESITILSNLNQAWEQAIESLRKERQSAKQGG